MDNKYEERLGTASMLPLILKMALPGFAAQLINLGYARCYYSKQHEQRKAVAEYPVRSFTVALAERY